MKMKFRVLENYSPRYWSHLDAIGAVLSLVAFFLIVSILSLAGAMDPRFSQEVTNFNYVGEGILVTAAVITIITFFLLILQLILMATSTNFIQEKEGQLLYILGINPAEEQLLQVPQPSKPRDKLGMEEEGRWTFNGSEKSKLFGNTQQQGKWTFGQFKKIDESQL